MSPEMSDRERDAEAMLVQFGIVTTGSRIREFADMLAEERAELEAALREVDNCFVGRDPEGAPAGDGTYWVGHSTALRVWYALHPDKLPDVTSDLGF